MNLLSIKQVATVLEVTPQAIYKRINDTDGNNELIKHIQTDDKGRKLIDNEGLEYLRQVFNKTADNVPLNNLNNELIELLKAELKQRDGEITRLHSEIESIRAEYKNQLRVKDEQIEREQQIKMASVKQQQQVLIEAPGRKSWFDRFKKGVNHGN